jgi:hypothetical protein
VSIPVGQFLRLDALYSAHEHDGAAADILRASINNARSLGDEPAILGFAVYARCIERTHIALMDVLGRSTLTPTELKTLQDALQSEIVEPRFARAVRRERAYIIEMDRAIREGRLTADAMFRRGWRRLLPDWLLGPRPPENRAHMLRIMSEAVDASRLPVEQQLDAMRQITEARKHQDPSTERLMQWLRGAVVDDQMSCQADLRTAVLALAAERYRIAEGTWPKSAEFLMQAKYLKAVPLDPCDGRPVRYRRLLDGVIFYSIGPDRVDNGGAQGTDIGFRLWDPDARRRPPMAR